MGATLSCSEWPSHCSGFSCGGAWALGHADVRASIVMVQGLGSCGSQAQEHRFSRCGAWA